MALFFSRFFVNFRGFCLIILELLFVKVDKCLLKDIITAISSNLFFCNVNNHENDDNFCNFYQVLKYTKVFGTFLSFFELSSLKGHKTSWRV